MKMVSGSTPSANQPAKVLILVQTVQLKPIIKAQISGIMVSIGIIDVATVSMRSKKARLKKLLMMKMIIGRTKRAPHWGVQSRFRVIYIYVCLSYVKSRGIT